jgi:hypothetical protein
MSYSIPMMSVCVFIIIIVAFAIYFATKMHVPLPSSHPILESFVAVPAERISATPSYAFPKTSSSSSVSVSSDTRRFTVWIYTEHASNISFHDAFCGFQRLALATAHTHLHRKCRFQFLHADNLRQFLPHVSQMMPFVDATLKRDYCKYQILATHGGMWISPSTVVLTDLHALFDQIQTTFRMEHPRYADLPLALVTGVRPVSSAYKMLSIPDDTCILCEPNNPILQRIARVVRQKILGYSLHPSHTFASDTMKMLTHYSLTEVSGREAHSLRRLPYSVVPMEVCMSLHAHAPVQHFPWFSFDSYMTRMQTTRKYGWFGRLSEDHILAGEMWISNLYRHALRFEGGVSTLLVHGQPNPLQKRWNQAYLPPDKNNVLPWST